MIKSNYFFNKYVIPLASEDTLSILNKLQI